MTTKQTKEVKGEEIILTEEVAPKKATKKAPKKAETKKAKAEPKKEEPIAEETPVVELKEPKGYSFNEPTHQAELKHQYFAILNKVFKAKAKAETKRAKIDELNDQYTKLWAEVGNKFVSSQGVTYEKPVYEAPDEFIDAVNALMGLDGIVVELLGTWIWVGGDTKPHKETLKAAGYTWCGGKQKWAWSRNGYSGRRRNKNSYDDIKAKFAQ